MAIINKLPDTLINQIAAGEVVERPASVVKEVVENSIDAGATTIEIFIEEGGKKLIKVIDNGSGIEKDELGSTVKRHWTSKMSSDDDLFNIQSLGFRGEALASISSVSDFIVQSRTSKSDSGYKASFVDGEVGDIEEVGMPVGTEISVADLFKNIPARLNFLKKDQTEFNHISELIHKLALVHQDIVFKLHNNRKLVFQSEKGNVGHTLKVIVGEELFEKLLPIQERHPQVAVSGWVGAPGTGVARKPKQYVFVNGRPIEDKTIWGAVHKAYGSLMGRHEKPQFAVMLAMSPHLLDVNVHPRKSEVRFTTPGLIFQLVQQAASRVLTKIGVSEEQLHNELPEAEKREQLSSKVMDTPKLRAPDALRAPDSLDSPSQLPMPMPKTTAPSKPPTTYERPSVPTVKQPSPLVSISDGSSIFQVHNLFLFEETSEGMNVYDQHAVHERVLYEELASEYLDATKKQRSQPLLFPEEIELTSSQMTTWNDENSFFEKLGFEINAKDDSHIQVKQVPVTLADVSIKTAIIEFLDDIEQGQEMGDPTTNKIDDQTHRRLAYMACRSAVKAGDRLTQIEMQNLLAQYRETDINATCPHGRPVKIEFSKEEMKKWFKR